MTIRAFDNYEISPCQRHEEPDKPGHFYFEVCDPAEADVWTLYGHIPGEGVEAIADCQTEQQAEELFHRITGQAFGSHEENEARIRLMLAAPNLLAVLEPYAVEAKNQINVAHASDFDNLDELETLLRPLIAAYDTATPIPAGAAAVTRHIEKLMVADFIQGWEPGEYNPAFIALKIDVAGRFVTHWHELDPEQQRQALGKHVDWEGFDWDDIRRVTENVLAGKPKQQWFEGTGDAM